MDLANLNNTLYTVLWLSVYLIVLIAFVSVLLALFLRRKRKSVEDLSKFNLTFLLVKLPPENETKIEAAEQFFASLGGFKRSWFKALC